MKKYISVSLSALIFSALFIMLGCEKTQTPKLNTEYQALFLGNGQTVFGKAEFIDKDYVLLKDVFYLQTAVNQETGQASNTLIKKGQEWHGADQMHINTRYINIIEPVAPESRVATLIKEAKAQKSEDKK